MTPIQLYDYPTSGNCYKVRLMLSLLGLEYRRVPVDFLAGETLTPEFKAFNPRGQIPLLADEETLVWDSMAILFYLARRYGEGRWLPGDPLGETRVMQWLAVSGNELLYGLARARAVCRLNRPFNLEQCQKEGRAGLAAMESRLSNAAWLVGEAATIADVACYPYVALAHEGEVSLEPYPGVREWLGRVEALPGWVAMEG